MEPIIAKAATQARHRSGGDPSKINAPAGKAPFGPTVPAADGRHYVTSAFVREALDKGAELFNWDERRRGSGKRRGTKVRGIGVAVSAYYGRLDRLRRPAHHPARRQACRSSPASATSAPTRSSTCQRVAAEMLGVPWEQCEVVWGNTTKGLPWTCVSGGSQTTHAMTRAAHAAATDAKKKLQEVAAKALGGNPDSLQGGQRPRLQRRPQPDACAQAAQKAIELGGKYDGHEVARGHQRLHQDVDDQTWPARA